MDELTHILPGYTFIFANRTSRRGGGVGIFIQNHLAQSCSHTTHECFFNETHEGLMVTLPDLICNGNNPKKNLLIFLVYRQAGNINHLAFKQIFESNLNRICQNRKTSINGSRVNDAATVTRSTVQLTVRTQ